MKNNQQNFQQPAEKTRFSKTECGYSLIEIIIAMTVFLIVTGSIYSLLQVGRIDRNRASRRSDVMKNARVAIHLMGRDALNAGLGYHRRGAIVPDDFISTRLQLMPDTDNDRDLLTAIIAGNNLFQNNLQIDINARTDIVSFAFRDSDFPIVNLNNVNIPGGLPSTARLQTNDANGTNGMSPFDLYLVESDTSQVAVMPTTIVDGNDLDIAPSDPLNLNQPMNGASQNGSMLRKCSNSTDTDCMTYVATLKRFFWVSYRVKQDGTLVRIVYGNNRNAPASEQIQEYPIAHNVQDLQMKYVLVDGTVTENPTVDESNLIRQIVVSIKVLSNENDEQLGKPGSVTLNATFSARNLEYDAG